MPDDVHVKGRKWPTVIPDARLWSAEQVAARLNRSVPWFYDNRRRLEQLGMPRRDEDLGGWDSKAFEAWLDRRAGLDCNMSIENAMLEAIHGTDHAALHQ